MRLRVHVPLVREHPDEPDAVEGGDALGELDRIRSGRDAEPVHPAVEFEQHRDRESARRGHPRDAERHDLGVDGDRDGHATRQIREPVELPLTDERIADKDVLDAGARHHLRFAQLRHLHAGGSGLELDARDLGQLVGLRVRPHRHAGLARERRNPGDVGADGVQVEDDVGCVVG